MDDDVKKYFVKKLDINGVEMWNIPMQKLFSSFMIK